LVKRYTNGVSVLSQACPGLVDAVESGALDTPETTALLERYLSPMIEAEVDQLVLGCTHYPFLRPIIEKFMGPGTRVIDPAPSIARQVANILTQREPRIAFETESGPGPNFEDHHLFCTSGHAALFSEMIKRLLCPSLGGMPAVRTVGWRGGRLELQP
jgi:glutamate racemase